MVKVMVAVGLGALSVGATDASAKLIENQSIGLPAAAAILVTVISTVLYIEHRYSKTDVRLTQIDQALRDLPCLKNGCNAKRKRK